MQTDWKIDVAMVDSMGDPLDNVMHSIGALYRHYALYKYSHKMQGFNYTEEQ